MPDSPSRPLRIDGSVGHPGLPEARTQVPSPDSGRIRVRVEGDALLEPDTMGLEQDIEHLIAEITRSPVPTHEAVRPPDSHGQSSPELPIMLGGLQLEPRVQAYVIERVRALVRKRRDAKRARP